MTNKFVLETIRRRVIGPSWSELSNLVWARQMAEQTPWVFEVQDVGHQQPTHLPGFWRLEQCYGVTTFPTTRTSASPILCTSDSCFSTPHGILEFVSLDPGDNDHLETAPSSEVGPYWSQPEDRSLRSPQFPRDSRNMLFSASPVRTLLRKNDAFCKRFSSSIAKSVASLKGQDFMSIDQLQYV